MTLHLGWSDVAEAYDATFARLCAGARPAILAAAGVGRADGPQRVVDVGAGTGTLAAAVVATGAAVSMVEPDPAMLALARATAPAVVGHLAALPALPFRDATFDAVIASFVVNHLRDPRAGVAELARVAAPGAPVVVTIWPSGENAQSRMWARVVEDGGAVVPPGTRLSPDLDFPRTVDGLQDLLAEHLDEVTAIPVRWTHQGPVDSLWRGAAAGIGGIGATVRAQSPPVRDRMRAAYDVHVQELVADGQLSFETEAVLGRGVRPPQRA